MASNNNSQNGEDYTLKQGDCIDNISSDRGFFWQTIWEDAANNQLKAIRSDPFVLVPGDTLHIPPKRPRQESGPTEQRHRFRRKGTPSYLRITLLEENVPRANEPYIIGVDGIVSEGQTDENGKLKHPILPTARRARLTLTATQTVYEIDLGHIDPVDRISGVQKRLQNLGFYAGPTNGQDNDELHSAITAFQEKKGLSLTGTIDDATRQKLEETYGS
ncbi:hypothetical protein DSCO28_11120 [Desulfosarcina ovata subsp. sediminis]|uniref:Peptidoglycan binding-like domain-containing protein n=1 Tax=Desulfosarcina ovata subsp. sediminis TaxID=885957 RepID=A0A5K7ZHT4_9BACT|nr:peptidoglycan-binding domain-containing protein [Desulfosarcina ovata]BBO80546.1 hypothetical protein DSCO28_11120 [Desulfosarcina ovata subsp. sediminis]